MNFLVTGATGYVGRALVAELQARGHDVVAFHRPKSDLTGLSCRTVSGNLLSADDLEKALRGCDGVFHVAGNTSWWKCDRETVRRANVDSTVAMLEAMRRAGVKRGVLTSSVSSVGITDDPERPADEETPFNWPDGFHYPRSKRDAEERWLAAGLVSVNPAAVFGPGDADMKVGVLFRRVQKGKFPILPRGGFSTVDVRDVARGHVLAFERGTPGHRYLLTGENVAFAEFGRRVAAALGAEPPRRSVPVFAVKTLAALTHAWEWLGTRPEAAAAHLWCMTRYVFHSGEKARRDLGHETTPLDRTLSDSVAWYRSKGMI